MSNAISFSIVGSGGDGAVAAGDIVAMACAGDGLHVIKTEAYGPQIRGGESSCSVRISAEPIFAQAGVIDTLVVFSWSDFARFASEMQPAADGIVFYEADDAPPENTPGVLVPVYRRPQGKDHRRERTCRTIELPRLPSVAHERHASGRGAHHAQS
jgi:Pyruvate/2-oxoacid:ferredoxin oxidoreductase gamma subunit